MCLCPRKIPNPARNWHFGMPKYIVIECGQCSECRARRQQEWYIRTSEEFRNNRNGSNYFFTLTFRNEDLPFYEDIRDFEFVSKEKEIGSSVYENVPVKVKKHVMYRFPCFDNEMITSFKKKFLVYLQREYPNYDVSGLKWFICGEFGKNTRRAHYHGDLFCPFFLPVSVFKKLVCKSWIHGFVGASKNKGFLIKNESACQYTSKYVNKDLYYFNDAMSKYLDKEHLDPAEYAYRYSKVKRYLPKIRVSQHFGESLARKIKAMSNPIEYCCLPRPVQRFSKSQKIVHYALPRYVVSKLTREVDKLSSQVLGRVTYRYTDFGMKLRHKMFEHRCRIDSVELSKFMDSKYIKDTLSKVDFSNDLKMRDFIAENLPPLFRSFTCEQLTFYRRLLRYLPVDMYGKHTAFWYNRRKDMIIKNFFKVSVNRDLHYELLDKLYEDGKPYLSYEYVGMPLKDYGDLSQIPTLSDTGEFRLYEQACKLIDTYYRMHGRQRSEVIDSRNERIDKVRDMCAEFVNYDSDGKSVRAV